MDLSKSDWLRIREASLKEFLILAHSDLKVGANKNIYRRSVILSVLSAILYRTVDYFKISETILFDTFSTGNAACSMIPISHPSRRIRSAVEFLQNSGFISVKDDCYTPNIPGMLSYVVSFWLRVDSSAPARKKFIQLQEVHQAVIEAWQEDGLDFTLLTMSQEPKRRTRMLYHEQDSDFIGVVERHEEEFEGIPHQSEEFVDFAVHKPPPKKKVMQPRKIPRVKVPFTGTPSDFIEDVFSQDDYHDDFVVHSTSDDSAGHVPMEEKPKKNVMRRAGAKKTRLELIEINGLRNSVDVFVFLQHHCKRHDIRFPTDWSNTRLIKQANKLLKVMKDAGYDSQGTLHKLRSIVENWDRIARNVRDKFGNSINLSETVFNLEKVYYHINSVLELLASYDVDDDSSGSLENTKLLKLSDYLDSKLKGKRRCRIG
jgi:hypothetical protein